MRWRNRSGALRNDCGIAIVTGRELRNDAGSRHVMVAPGEEGGARRRAQGRRVETCVTKSLRGQLLDIWGWHPTSKRAELSVTRIIEQDQKHVRRALGRT